MSSLFLPAGRMSPWNMGVFVCLFVGFFCLSSYLQLRETFLCWLTVRNMEVGEREGRQANSPSLT